MAATPPSIRDARDWVVILSRYREPCHWRSSWEILVTAGPFVALWALAWWSLDVSYALAAALSVLNATFLARLFMIQHDCGHASFFRSRAVSDWLGRVLGVVTLTPYDVWRRTHAAHHSSAGNLGKRGMGDVLTLTVTEFRNLSPLGRLRYRLYRHPLVLFGLGPFYLFFLQNRVPFGLMDAGARYWISAMATNAALAVVLGGILYLGGIEALLFVFFPMTLVAASIGVWMFYVQHSSRTRAGTRRTPGNSTRPRCTGARTTSSRASCAGSRRTSGCTTSTTCRAGFRSTGCRRSCATIPTSPMRSA
jgi:omega-6 fatty acid desaturase (delta-12 desaturase)